MLHPHHQHQNPRFNSPKTHNAYGYTLKSAPRFYLRPQRHAFQPTAPHPFRTQPYPPPAEFTRACGAALPGRRGRGLSREGKEGSVRKDAGMGYRDGGGRENWVREIDGDENGEEEGREVKRVLRVVNCDVFNSDDDEDDDDDGDDERNSKNTSGPSGEDGEGGGKGSKGKVGMMIVSRCDEKEKENGKEDMDNDTIPCILLPANEGLHRVRGEVMVSNQVDTSPLSSSSSPEWGREWKSKHFIHPPLPLPPPPPPRFQTQQHQHHENPSPKTLQKRKQNHPLPLPLPSQKHLPASPPSSLRVKQARKKNREHLHSSLSRETSLSRKTHHPPHAPHPNNPPPVPPAQIPHNPQKPPLQTVVRKTKARTDKPLPPLPSLPPLTPPLPTLPLTPKVEGEEDLREMDI